MRCVLAEDLGRAFESAFGMCCWRQKKNGSYIFHNDETIFGIDATRAHTLIHTSKQLRSSGLTGSHGGNDEFAVFAANLEKKMPPVFK